MDGAHEVHNALTNLCKDIERWISKVAPSAQYRAPIIDWHHPDDYGQRGIQGLRKFLAHAAAERDHVESVSGTAAALPDVLLEEDALTFASASSRSSSPVYRPAS
jgi:hypothetical protein